METAWATKWDADSHLTKQQQECQEQQPQNLWEDDEVPTGSTWQHFCCKMKTISSIWLTQFECRRVWLLIFQILSVKLMKEIGNRNWWCLLFFPRSVLTWTELTPIWTKNTFTKSKRKGDSSCLHHTNYRKKNYMHIHSQIHTFTKYTYTLVLSHTHAHTRSNMYTFTHTQKPSLVSFQFTTLRCF